MPPKKTTPEGSAEFVAALVSDPANVPQTVMSTGYLGASSEKDHVRLYSDPQLSHYMEIPKGDLLHQMPASGNDPLGAVMVWIKASAKVIHKPEANAQSNAANFFGRMDIGTGNIEFRPTPVTIPPGLCTGTGPITITCPPVTRPPACPPLTRPPACPILTLQPNCPPWTRPFICPPRTQDNSPICNIITQSTNPICNFTRNNSPACFTRNQPRCDLQTRMPGCIVTGQRSLADGCGTRTTTFTGGGFGGFQGGGFQGGFQGGGLQPPPLGAGGVGAGDVGRMGGFTQFLCPTQQLCPTQHFCPTRQFCPTEVPQLCPTHNPLFCPTRNSPFCPNTLSGPACPITVGPIGCPPPLTRNSPFCPFTQNSPACPVTLNPVICGGGITVPPGCPPQTGPSLVDGCPSQFCPTDFGQTPVINPGNITPGIQPGGLF